MDRIKKLQEFESECASALKSVPGQRIMRFAILLGGIYNPYSKQDVASLPVRGPGEALAYLEGRRSIVLQLMKLSGLTQIGVQDAS